MNLGDSALRTTHTADHSGITKNAERASHLLLDVTTQLCICISDIRLSLRRQDSLAINCDFGNTGRNYLTDRLTVTPTLRSAGAITQAITGDGTTSTIVTRV